MIIKAFTYFFPDEEAEESYKNLYGKNKQEKPVAVLTFSIFAVNRCIQYKHEGDWFLGMYFNDGMYEVITGTKKQLQLVEDIVTQKLLSEIYYFDGKEEAAQAEGVTEKKTAAKEEEVKLLDLTKVK